jgi:prefoldin subunit 5
MQLNINATINVNHIGYVADVKLDKVLAQLEKVMSAISDFADKMNIHNTAIATAIAGLTGDVSNLQAQIAALQNSPGQITPADQALLDGIEAQTADVQSKLTALDSLTPPVVPATP